MTEQNLGQNISGDSILGSGAQSTGTPMQSTEEMISKSHATKLVNERYNAGYEKGRQEVLSAQQSQAQTQQQAAQKPDTDPLLHELKKEVSTLSEQLKKGEDERIAKEHQAIEQMRAQEIGNQLKPKIENARQKYSDFDSVVNQDSLKSVPGLIAFANEVDNAGEVMYEVLNNPERLGQLCALPNADFVRKAIHRLSNTLKTNQASASIKVPRSPISQPQASNVKNTEGNGSLTIKELRKKYRY